MDFASTREIFLTLFACVMFVGIVLFIIACIFIVAVYFRDSRQAKHAILRNFPVLGHFRYFFEFLGKFFRQYFFAADREELPFNRAQRTWVYRAAKNIDTTTAFGSTRSLTPGEFIFVPAPFPTLKEDSVPSSSLMIGDFVAHPYEAPCYFNTSGMSYGAISKPAVQALSKGCAMAGCWLNTGEGGISPYHLEGGCDLVAQIGTAKYGFRTLAGALDLNKVAEAAAFDQVKMFEIKLSQGAKPGKGGLLPAIKVTPEIAKIRGIQVHKDSMSPNRFPEIKSSADLLDMIAAIRKVANKPVGIKLVLGNEQWLQEFLETIHHHGVQSAPDFITIDSADGGTGAAPMPLMDYMGLQISESLPITVNLLQQYDLRNRIRVIASGKFITPSIVAWGLCVGADFIVNARGFMFSLGCIQAMHCNLNTCPTGITTHNVRLQEGLDPANKAVRVCNYVNNMHDEVGQIAHSCGVTEPRQLKLHHCRMLTASGSSISLNDLYKKIN